MIVTPRGLRLKDAVGAVIVGGASSASILYCFLKISSHQQYYPRSFHTGFPQRTCYGHCTDKLHTKKKFII